MVTMTATNQQYYAGYPQNHTVGMTSDPSQAAAAAAYNHHHHQTAAYAAAVNQHHRNHHQHHQFQQSHHHQQSLQPVYHQNSVVGSAAQTMAPIAANHHQTRTTLISSNNSDANSPVAATTNLYAIETSKSTKGASKLRRDLINTEIAQLRELLPLPASTRQRLSQLQLMALVLVYVRKSNYFCNGEYSFRSETKKNQSFPILSIVNWD